MGQYQISETGEITNSDGTVVGRVNESGRVELSDESLSSAVLSELRDQIAHNESLPPTESHDAPTELSQEPAESIRLACTYCDTDEADWVTEFPEGWEILSEVQSVEESTQEASEQRKHSSALEWYTHLGICPDCRDRAED